MAASCGEVSVDTTEIFKRHLGERQFDSWEDFQRALKTFEEETNSVFSKRNTKPVKSENARRREQIPERFRYAGVRFFCKHYGLPCKRGNGQRNAHRYLGLGCPVFFFVSYSRGALCVTKSSMCHRNHTLDAEANKYLACKRRLTEAEIESFQETIGLESSNECLKAYIRSKFNKQVNSSDLQNLRQKLKRKNNYVSEALTKALKTVEEDGGHVRLDVTDNSLNVLSFCTEKQRNYCVQYPEMLFIERTYRFNKSDFHLIQILVQDNYGHSVPVFFSFVCSKNANNIDILFKQFLQVMGSDLVDKNKSLMINCDHTILQATRDHFPNSNVLLCKSHVLQIFNSRVERLLTPAAEKDKVMSIFQNMVNASDIETYNSCCISLSEASSEIYQYFQENWEPLKRSWAMLHRHDCVTFGIDTNKRSDCEKGRLKQILKNSESLAKAVLSLCSKYNDQNDERLYKMFRQRFTSSIHGARDIHPKVAALYQHFTDYAVKRMISDHKSISRCKISHVLPNDLCILTVDEEEYIVDTCGSCNCQFYKQFSMPCLHIIFLFIDDILNTQDILAGSRWLKANSASVDSSSAITSVFACSKNPPAMTQSQNLRAINDLCQRLYLTLTRCSMNEFNERLAQLKSILDCWEKDEKVFLIVNETDPGHEKGLNEKIVKSEIPWRELGDCSFENGETLHELPVGEVDEGMYENGEDVKDLIPIGKLDEVSCKKEEITKEIPVGKVDKALSENGETTKTIPIGKVGQRLNGNMKIEEGLLEVSGGDEGIRQGEKFGEGSDDVTKIFPLSCITRGSCSKASRQMGRLNKRKILEQKSTFKRTKCECL